ncbi:MAG: hypothetical protein H0U95_18490 [Bacteroidetes bacterium]|nr:hypothetical protein [Bacteroidota bacterium]
MKEGYFQDEYSEMWIEDGIGFQVYKPQLVITIDVAKQMVINRIKTFDGIARPVLVDVRHLLTIDSPSRKYFASREAGQLILAGAIYLDSPIARFLGNIFLMIDKPITPARLFTDREKALQWIQQFKYMN